MKEYVCVNCKKVVDISKPRDEIIKYSRSSVGMKTIVVDCQHCGVANRFRVPQ